MYRWIYILVIYLIAFSSCTQADKDAVNKQAEVEDTLARNVVLTDTQHTAVCLWDKVGLRAAPGTDKDITYITTVYLGEQVYLFPDTAKVEKEGRIYTKVRLSDGQEGWVHEFVFGMDARLGAITQSTGIYRRPDPIMLKSEKFDQGEFVAVLDEKDDWIKVMGYQKKKVGWIQKGESLSEDLDDIKVVVWYQRAVREQELSKRVKLLKTILENTEAGNSTFIHMVRTDLAKNVRLLNKEEKLEDTDENQLLITAQSAVMRSRPDSEDDSVLIKLQKGAVCQIMGIWPPDSLRSNTDTWYEVIHEGKQGWIRSDYTSLYEEASPIGAATDNP